MPTAASSKSRRNWSRCAIAGMRNGEEARGGMLETDALVAERNRGVGGRGRAR
jgi:hypothetical protein